MAKAKAVFQEKSTKTGKFIGLKIYYYETAGKWWYVRVGKPFVGKKVPNFGTAKTGTYKNRLQYPTIASLEKYHAQDHIFKIR
jgi:hypothetical protein